ncbi:MAG: ATP-binding cassette domain-containing protein, partial [Sulfobacillus sp.]|nr:ATP-binding cassette domain-containing protein [Sulfobacillus sp.]
LYPKMRLVEQLEFFARLWGLGIHESRSRVAEWVDRLALQPYLDRRGSELSKGNARKAQMALALLGSPELLILDEPFEGMDPVNVRLMKDVIREIRGQGTTVLLSSHTMEFIEDLCQGVTVIQAGRAVAHGTLETVRQSLGYRVLKIAWGDLDVERLKDWERARRLTPEKVDGRERWYRLSETLDSQTLLSEVGSIGDVRFYSVGPPDLEDVYVALVQGRSAEDPS